MPVPPRLEAVTPPTAVPPRPLVRWPLPVSVPPPRTPRPLVLAALTVALAVGGVLRLLWTQDMEYKADEVWTFEQTRASHSGPWPRHGMPTSVEVANPGLSVWPFLVLARLTGA